MNLGLNNIVFRLNDAIKPVFLKAVFTGTQVHGMATSVIYRENDATRIAPMVWSKDGSGTYVGINQYTPAILYHKVSSVTPGIVPNSGYGDSRGKIRNTYRMAMYLYHDRKATNLEADDMYLLIQEVFPDQLTILPYDSVKFTLQNVILNTMQVFREEYSNVDFLPKPEHALTKVEYTIESTFKKGCFKPNDYILNVSQ